MAAPAAHRYWRLAVRQRNSNGLSNLATRDIQMKSGGTNRSVGATKTASSGANPSFFGDGNTGTSFSVAFTPIIYLNFDFGSGNAYDIDEIVYTPDATFPSFFSIGLTEVQYSDDGTNYTTSWIIFSPQTVLSWGTGNATFTRPARSVATTANARYWLWLFKTNKGGDNAIPSQYSIAEAELRLTSGGADQTGSGTAHSCLSSNASNAFNNNFGNQWLEDYTTSTALGYQFGSGVTKAIRAFTLGTASSGNQNGMPTSGTICCSDNMFTYWPIKDWTLSAAGWSTTSQVREVTFEPPFDNHRRQTRAIQ